MIRRLRTRPGWTCSFRKRSRQCPIPTDLRFNTSAPCQEAANDTREGVIKMAGRRVMTTAARRTIGSVPIVLGLALSAAPLAAADSEMTKEYLTCIEQSGGVTAQMLRCTSDEAARQDARLNENYKKLMSKLTANRKKVLLEAQRAW